MTGVGGVQNFVFPFGEQIAAEKHDDVSVQFQHNYFDEQFDVVLPTLTGTGTRGVLNSVMYVEGLAAPDVAMVSSRNSIRYRAGHSGYIDFTLGAETSGGGRVDIGGFDRGKQNGFCVSVDNGVLKFGFLKDGVELGSNHTAGFDTVDSTGLTLNAMNIYRIAFGYLGVANPTLFVKKGTWRLLHVVTTEGINLLTHASTPVFPMTIAAYGIAKGYSASWNGGVIGNGSSAGNRPFHFPHTLLTTGAEGSMVLTGTTVGTVVIFKAKDTFGSKTNSVKARLTGYSFNVELPSGSTSGNVLFQLVSVTTLSGAATYADINTTSSVIQLDHIGGTGATVTVTAGVPIADAIVSYVGTNKGGSVTPVTIDAEQLGAYAYAGDIFAIIAKDLGGNGVTVRASLQWEELF